MRRLLGIGIIAALAIIPITAKADLNVPGDYATIQEAIDAAVPGETIWVAAGTYEEQLNIDKQLTIIGEGAGATTVLSPDVLTDYFTSSDDNYPVVYIHDTDDVTIQDLTVDGAGKGNSNYRFIGIGLYNAGASILDCEVVNVTDTPFSGAQHGNCIYGWNNEGTMHTSVVSGTLVHGYQKGGIIFNGVMNQVTVTNCTAIGVGPTSAIAQNGIQFGWGATGSVSSCAVSLNSYTGGGWTSTGILLYGGDADISGTMIDECQTGVYYITSSGSFTENTITATREGVGLPESEWFYGLGIDDQGPGSPLTQPFDEGAAQGGGGRSIVSVSGCLFQGDGSANNIGVGVWAQAGDDLDVVMTGSEVYDWDYGIDVWDDGQTIPFLDVQLTCFTGNVSYAVYNETTAPTTTLAVENWWGDPSGPSGAGPGSGDAVSENVEFDPWLTENPCAPTAVQEATVGQIKALYK